ncbi:MAG: hypothetical protein PHT69_12740 [Bacteroidales bacterium]|nr:hypothetical protein [Bacteroidales bacterium]
MEKRSCIQFVELSNRKQIMKGFVLYDETVKETHYDLQEALAPYLSANALDEVVAMLNKHSVLLRIETPRKEGLGCYDWKHKICINNDLDKDSFLHVFLHEYAHLLTHLSFPKVSAHGAEFYYCFEELLLNMIDKGIIHQDMFLPIINYSGNYNLYKNHLVKKFWLKSIRVGAQAVYRDGDIIREKGQKGLINCMRLSYNERIQLDEKTEVLPVLDLSW